MGYATVEVDVDLNEIEDYDLFREVNQRLKRKKNEGRKTELIDVIKEELDFYAFQKSDSIKISTLDDTMKMELMIEAFNKYSLTELEQKLK